MHLNYSPTIAPTTHDRAEWARLAHDAYSRGFNSFGHRYSVAAAFRINDRMPLSIYDGLQHNYRIWLIKGFTPAGELVWD